MKRERTLGEVVDMTNNMNDMMNLYQRLRSNPKDILSSRFNIPSNIDINNPNAIVQHLLNTGQISQNQVNNAMQMRNNPMLQRLFNK